MGRYVIYLGRKQPGGARGERSENPWMCLLEGSGMVGQYVSTEKRVKGEV